MLRQEAVFTLLCGGLAFFALGWRPGILLGILAGWGDIALILWGVWTGMQKEARKAASGMHVLMAVRIVFLLALAVTAIRGRWNPALVFAGFLLYHVFFFIQLFHARLDEQK